MSTPLITNVNKLKQLRKEMGPEYFGTEVLKIVKQDIETGIKLQGWIKGILKGADRRINK